jgi:HEPN domain-containing protein
MRFYFTKRHEDALKEKRLKPYLPNRLRLAIRRTLNDYSTWGGCDNEENRTFYAVENKLKTFYGEEQLRAFSGEGKLAPTDLNGLIDRGFPARVLDLIEVWCDCAEPSKVIECEKELNTLFEISNSPWRVVNSTVNLIDSEYLHNEVIAKTQNLLRENSVEGALEEFTDAISFLTDGRTKDAIVYAHKSVESVMKTCLETEEHLTFGELLQRLIKSGIIPKYYNEFLTHFEKLALGAVKERNLPARGHGQGATPTEVPKSLAEFAVHIAAVVNLFIVKRWIESRPPVEEEIIEEDDVPF